MSEVLYFLFLGVFFYAVMRWGCGAHMMHGAHQSHGDKPEEKGSHPAHDPVCGMELDARTAQFFQPHRRGIYYFCSDSCKNKFQKDPEKYSEPMETPGRR